MTHSVATFWSTLRIKALAFSLPETADVSRTAGGEMTIASLGARLWRASVTVDISAADNALAMQALLRQLRRPGETALITPLIGRTPKLDVTGSVLASTVTVSGIRTDRTGITLAGLPSGYTLSNGDYLSIDVSGVPHLHQIVFGGAAPSGTSPDMDVVPAIKVSVLAGAPVTLVDPAMKAVLDPASVREGKFTRTILSGVSFDLIQTLR